MITIISFESEKIHDSNFRNAKQALKFLMNLDSSNKDIYIDHKIVEQTSLETRIIINANHIIMHDKLIGS